MNEKIYIPDYTTGKCAYIYNSDIIRVYDSVPHNNSTVNYTDFYIKSSYISNRGSTTFGQYSTLPTCITDSRITTEVYYRNDFPSILIIFFIMSFISFWVPWKIFIRLFRRFN